MHELSLCQALIDQVERIAQEQGAVGVATITVGIGSLSGVEPLLLQQAYPLACAGTIAEAAELHVRNLPVRVRCRTCGVESDAVPNRLICAACGDWHTDLVSGDEMLLERVELEMASEHGFRRQTGPVME